MKMTQTEFIQLLKAEVKKMGSVSKLASQLDVSRTYLYAMLQGKYPASARVCKAFGVVRSVKITREYTYKRD